MGKYEINAIVTMYIEASSLKEAKAIADDELSWSDSVESINIIQAFEFDDEE